MATLRFFQALNNINKLLHECPHFCDIMLLTVNHYGRVLVHFDKSVTERQIINLMSEIHVTDYKLSFSDMHYTNCVSFKYDQLPGE